MTTAISLATLLQSADLWNLGLKVHTLQNFEALQITGLATDSRAVKSGDFFIGLPGSKVDGGGYWSQAFELGAVAALVAQHHQPDFKPEGCLLTLPSELINQGCGQLAASYFHRPTESMSVIGVTGTNGKTTTTHLIEYLLKSTGQSVGLIGTLYNRWADHCEGATHTTPFAVELQHRLYQMQQAGCQAVVMEVSSHALAQQRVWGCQFERAVWTNLTQDHLDFHTSMEAYWQAKALLFQPTYLRGRAIVNGDDPGGQQLIQTWPQSHRDLWTFSLKHPDHSSFKVDLWPSEVELGASTIRAVLHTPFGECPIQIPMAGSFNLANLLAAVGAVLEPNTNLNQLAEALGSFSGVPGRMEMITVTHPAIKAQDIAIIVDYAHTPDGLENLLRAAKPLTQGQLWCVFGCGGDRDRTKRPQMGQIAANLADQVVVTSDNPRTEDPQQILDDILAGIDQTAIAPYVEPDRQAAIHHTIRSAQAGDIVVIAGKGHEDYQILGTTKIHFDDREEAQLALMQRLTL